MRNKTKINFIILTLGLILLISSNCKNIFNDKHDINNLSKEIEEKYILKAPKLSNYWNNFTYIHINGNWSTAASYEWCRGDGSWDNPYIIENITINASSSATKSGIFIENSKNDYFVISNCTIYNTPVVEDAAGIKLKNVNNGTILNNYCYGNNGAYGIYLLGTSSQRCENNTIINNFVTNHYNGIFLNEFCDYNYILGNTANKNFFGGIVLDASYYNNITGNTANENILPHWSGFYGTGIYLKSSDYNTIHKNNCNNNKNGISLYLNNDWNNITENIANYNTWGISLQSSDNNRIINNKFLEDVYPIGEWECEGNIFDGNLLSTPEDDDDDDDKKKDTEEAIPGYEILVIISLIAVVSIVLLKSIKKKLFK